MEWRYSQNSSSHPHTLPQLPDRVYLVTEKVVPLEEHLESPDGQSKFSTAWGLHQLLVSSKHTVSLGEKYSAVSLCQKGLAFLSNDCALVHNNVNLTSVFVDEAGEWKLGGVEFMASFTDSATLAPAGKILQRLRKYDPPESSKPGPSRKSEKWSGSLCVFCWVFVCVCVQVG